MVAVRSADADHFINRPPAGVFLYLVFGTDAGLVAERMRTLLARAVDDPRDPFQLLRLSGDELAGDPMRLADEANAVPMFGGGRKAIGIEATGKSLVAAIEPVLRAQPRDCVIAVEAGAMKRDHPLRKLFEGERAAAAIECHPDGPAEVARLVDSELAGAGLTIEPEAKELLLTLLGQDRLTTRSELEKLALYAHGLGRVEASHVEAIVADASAILVDHAVEGAFGGDLDAIEHVAERLFGDAGDTNVLLGATLRYAIALHRARVVMDAGGRFAEAGGFYGPRRATAERLLRRWDAARLARIVAALNDAIARARREPRLAQPVAMRALWAVALGARRENG